MEGSLTSNPNIAYVLNFYSNAEVDASGYGEGETWLGSLDVQTNAQSTVGFSFPLESDSFGRFITATATDPAGNTSEFSLASAVVPPLSRFLNISTRLRVQTGDNVLIGGFIITGNDPKEVIVRAIGPSLGDFGVANPLANPSLELNYPGRHHRRDRTTTGATPRKRKSSPPAWHRATTSNPPSSPPSTPALTPRSCAGSAAAPASPWSKPTTLAPALDSALANISTRGLVETGDNVMIGGIIVGPDAAPSGSILLRAIGPSLGDFGITNPLANPTLELRDGNGLLVRANDNWKGTQQVAIEATGLAPTRDLESAILATLPAGNYTAIMSGVGGTTGIGLVEAYHLD